MSEDRITPPVFGRIPVILALCTAALASSRCSAPSGLPPAALSPTIAMTALPTTTDRWFQLMLRTPYPWTTPLPPPTRTGVDGTYAKLDPSEPQ